MVAEVQTGWSTEQGRDPNKEAQLIFSGCAKQFIGEKMAFPLSGSRAIRYPQANKTKSPRCKHLHLTAHENINSKYITCFYLKCETLGKIL